MPALQRGFHVGAIFPSCSVQGAGHPPGRQNKKTWGISAPGFVICGRNLPLHRAEGGYSVEFRPAGGEEGELAADALHFGKVNIEQQQLLPGAGAG